MTNSGLASPLTDLEQLLRDAGAPDRSFLWYISGALLCVAVSFGLSHAELRHVSAPSEFHEVGWSYVTLVISVLSLLYPLALTLRESLTARVFGVFDDLKSLGGEEVATDSLAVRRFYEETVYPVQRFRRWVFGRQLPLLASFSICSTVRVLLCMIGVGPLPVSQQMLEPQVFAIIYLAWMITMMATIGATKPFRAVEIGEARVRRMIPLERRRGEEPGNALAPDIGNSSQLKQGDTKPHQIPRRRRRRRNRR